MRLCRSIAFLFFVCIQPYADGQSPDLDKASNSSRNYIPDSLEFPEFTPPAPPVAKVLPQIRIDSSVTVRAENAATTITIQRGEASTLPDLPPPAKPAPADPPRDFTSDELAELKWQRQHTINLGATVYDHKISEVQWTDQDTGKSYQALCGFDISLLAGLGGFVHHGESYQLFLMHSSVDTRAENAADASDIAIPEIPAGQIRITQGNPDAAALASLRAIQEVITSEKPRLLTYQSAREKYEQESAVWFKANPPVIRDETYILRPHRGSRYLNNAQPDQKGGAR